MTRAQIGDIVHVRAKVVDIATTDAVHPVKVQFSEQYDAPDWAWIHPSKIVKVEPPPLKPGDRVRLKQHPNSRLTVVAVHGDWAWVEFNGTHAPKNAELTELERVP